MRNNPGGRSGTSRAFTCRTVSFALGDIGAIAWNIVRAITMIIAAEIPFPDTSAIRNPTRPPGSRMTS